MSDKRTVGRIEQLTQETNRYEPALQDDSWHVSGLTMRNHPEGRYVRMEDYDRLRTALESAQALNKRDFEIEKSACRALRLYGVPRERAGSVGDGIEALTARQHCEIQALQSELSEARELLRESAKHMEIFVRHAYRGRTFPAAQGQYDSDMALPRRIRAALADDTEAGDD